MALLRVATFNLLHGMAPHDQRVDAARLRESVRALDCDLVGLQEVDRGQPRSGGTDQTAVVAEALGAAWRRFVPAVHGTPAPVRSWTPASATDGDDTVGPTYGIGLVSRLPVRSWWVKRFPPAPVRLPLPTPPDRRGSSEIGGIGGIGGSGSGSGPRLLLIPDEPRVALAAVVEGPYGPFTAVTAHLSFVPGFNARQLRRIAIWVARMPQPVLLFGDFNLPHPLPARITGWQSLVRARTYPASDPRVQLDHVLALGLGPDHVTAGRAWELAVSDHRALTVDLELAAFNRGR